VLRLRKIKGFRILRNYYLKWHIKIYEVTKTYPTEERLSDILNVDYHHLVFTIPWQLRSIILANAKVMLYIIKRENLEKHNN